ncbi:MAG: hypothetical protein K2W96_22830 [Gemmataceae bacterium]|nr:hypothetical protein [Gemmataceae bacterium]
MRAVLIMLFVLAAICLVAGGVLLLPSLLPSPAPADIVADLETAPDLLPAVDNDAVLVLRNTGGRSVTLLNIPSGG